MHVDWKYQPIKKILGLNNGAVLAELTCGHIVGIADHDKSKPVPCLECSDIEKPKWLKEIKEETTN